MSGPTASYAASLVKTIDELLEFVLSLRRKQKRNWYFPADEEAERLFELEGRVVGLHAVVADGRLPFKLREWNLTLVSGGFLNDFFDTPWEIQMRSLRASTLAFTEPTSTSQPFASNAQDKTIDGLGDRQLDVLRTLYDKKAFDRGRRLTTQQIADEVTYKEPTAIENYKVPISRLHHSGFVDTKGGRGGGCWLTAKGIEVAKRIIERNL
jgi:hypothetical protein